MPVGRIMRSNVEAKRRPACGTSDLSDQLTAGSCERTLEKHFRAGRFIQVTQSS